MFSQALNKWSRHILMATPLPFLLPVIYSANKPGICLYVMLWMVVYWVSAVIPLPGDVTDASRSLSATRHSLHRGNRERILQRSGSYHLCLRGVRGSAREDGSRNTRCPAYVVRGGDQLFKVA
ncbi:hypothetical protein MTO96_052091 [Rhipicephalus appendiculatus]